MMEYQTIDNLILKTFKYAGAKGICESTGLPRDLIDKRIGYIRASRTNEKLFPAGLDDLSVKISNIKESVKIGDRVRGQKVIEIYEHFIVTTNGRYRDTFTWFDLAQAPARKLKKAS